MGASILEVDRHEQVRLAGRVAAAWRAVGRRGRVVAVLGGAACAAVALVWLDDSPPAVATALSLLVLVVAALVDAAEHRLPNALVAGAAIPVVVAVAVDGSAGLLRSAALGGLLVATPMLVTHLVTPSGMGFGDVKAAAVLGAAMGLIDVESALLALVLGLAAGAAWGVGRRARSIALGPALVAGAVAAALIGAVS